MEGCDWNELKRAVTYNPSDYLAVLRDPDFNMLSWLPLFHNEATGEAFIKRDGRWEAVAMVQGIERYEELKPLKIKTRSYFDTATLESWAEPV